MTAQADTTARLTRAERVLTCTVLAPFVMILPTVLVLVRFDHGETAWEAVYRFAVVPVAAVGLVLVVPLVFAFQSFGIHAYRFDRDEVATLPVDWTAPGWARIRAAVAGTGRDLAGVPAVSTIAVKANLRVVHRTRQMPGRWGRWSDWSVARLKVFAITGAVVGILAGVLNEVRPGWFDVPYFRRGTPLIARGADNHHLFVLRSGAADVRDQDGELVERLRRRCHVRLDHPDPGQPVHVRGCCDRRQPRLPVARRDVLPAGPRPSRRRPVLLRPARGQDAACRRRAVEFDHR